MDKVGYPIQEGGGGVCCTCDFSPMNSNKRMSSGMQQTPPLVALALLPIVQVLEWGSPPTCILLSYPRGAFSLIRFTSRSANPPFHSFKPKLGIFKRASPAVLSMLSSDLQKYFSHPSLVIYFFFCFPATPPKKLLKLQHSKQMEDY